jgi:hypothetical protein
MDALLAYPSVNAEWKAPSKSVAKGRAADRTPNEGSASRLPVIPISFVKDGQVLNYFSMVATVGTPQTIAAQELRLECMFPVDEATEARHLEIMRQFRASGSRSGTTRG